MHSGSTESGLGVKLYLLVEDADFGCDGRHHHIMGIYTTKEAAVAEMQREHQVHDLTTWGLLDYRLYEIELDVPDGKYKWDYYHSSKFADTTERTVCLGS